MALTTKTLFPPILDTTLPAFIRTSNCRIYFDFPTYNSTKDVNGVQVILNNQNNNLSAFKNSLHPTGIKLTTFDEEMVNGVLRYYIEIEPSELEGGIFALNQYYKVQLRFVSSSVVMPANNKVTSSWIAENKDGFSEWSSVCLIRGIASPYLTFKGLVEDDEDQSVVIASQVVDFIGQLNFDENEQDSLEQYNIVLYEDTDLDNSIADSGIIYTNTYSPNDINYTFRKELVDGNNYVAIVSYKTKAGFESYTEYRFSIILYDMEKMRVSIEAIPEDDFGRIKIHIKSYADERFTGNLTIRRSDSRSDFTLWDDVYTQLISTGEVLDFTWYDNTVESGIWYSYCVQKRNSRGDRGIITKIDTPVLCYFEDMFLVRDSKMIKVRFDQQVTSLKRALIETKTDTIGGKYPFIRRNANTNYRQFQISGLITRFMDDTDEFTSPSQIYGKSEKFYNEYNEENKISKSYDFIYEREFREKILEFLHESKVTLFKSLTEGNILVKLMDVSIQPNTTLGRRLYSFTAMAYEVDDATVYNFNKYGIQSFGKLDPLVQYSSSIVGQVYKNFNANEEIISIIRSNQAEKSDSGFENIVQNINYLRVQIIPTETSKRRLVQQNGDQLSYVTRITTTTKNVTRGTIMRLNGKNILINPDTNYYEVFGVDIKSLSFPALTYAVVDYGCDLEKKEANSKLAVRYYYFKKNGQIRGLFEPYDYMVQKLNQKYGVDFEESYQRLAAVNSITIWADPSTVVYIKDSSDEGRYNRFVIGSDGVLEFSKSGATIEDFYFYGRNLKPKPLDREIPRKDEYQSLIDDETSEERYFVSVEAAKEWTARLLKYQAKQRFKKENPALDEMQLNKKVAYLQIKPHLMENTIYWIVPEDSGVAKRYVCINGELIYCPGPNAVSDVMMSVEANVDYYIDIIKGEY